MEGTTGKGVVAFSTMAVTGASGATGMGVGGAIFTGGETFSLCAGATATGVSTAIGTVELGSKGVAEGTVEGVAEAGSGTGSVVARGGTGALTEGSSRPLRGREVIDGGMSPNEASAKGDSGSSWSPNIPPEEGGMSPSAVEGLEFSGRVTVFASG